MAKKKAKTKKNSFWIQKAISKPGALKRQLNIPEDEKIPASILEKASKAKGTLGKRARLAKTLKKISKRKKK